MERPGAPRIYLAGPLGFSPAGLEYHQDRVVPKIRNAGFEPLDPWDLPQALEDVMNLARDDPRRATALPIANRDVGRRNAEMIRACDAVLAVLDGSDVDSGTAAEIGYAAALGKPVIGLRTDLRLTGDNEATLVNLQVEWFIVESRWGLAKDVTDTVDGGLATDLDDAIRKLVALVPPSAGRVL